MNSLEHYIKEIKSEEPYEAEWTKKYNKEFVRAVVIHNCHGAINEDTLIESKENWEKIKEQGFFWA